MRNEFKPAPFVLTTLALAGVLVLTACRSETPQSMIALAQQHEAKKDWQAAVVQYKAALQLDPNSPEIRFLVGKSLLAAGDPASAALELSKALDLKFPPEKVLPELSRALLLAGDYKKLTTQYGDITLDDKAALAELKSNVARAWGTLGEKGKTEAAVAASLAAMPGYAPAMVLQASLTAGRGDFAGALKLVNEIVAKDPSVYEAWMLQGEIQLAKDNDRKAAEASFRKVLTLERAHLPAHAALISGYLVQGDIPAAKAQADELRKVLPNHPQTMFVDAVLAYSEQDLTRARDTLQQLLRILPDHVSVLQLAGVVEGRLGGLVLAESHFSKALSLNPNLPEARLNLARVYIATDQPGKALDTLRPLLTTKGASSEAHAIAGDAMLRLGEAAEAERHFNQASALNPSDVKSRAAVALARLSRGETGAAFDELAGLAQKSKETYADLALVSARLRRQEYPAALAATDAMLKKAPQDAKVYELRGRILTEMRNPTGAREAFEQALKLDPGFVSAVAHLVDLDILQKQPEQARKRVEARIASDPSNYHYRLLMAELRSREGAGLDEVLALLADAAKRAPTQAEPRLLLIDQLLRHRQFKKAIAAADDALAAQPNDPNTLDAAGRAYMEGGDSERAINTFRKLAGALPGSGSPYMRLAAAYRIVGQPALCENAWKKSLELEPGLRPAQRGWVEFLLSAKRIAEAQKYVADLQRKFPERPEPYMLESDVQMRALAPDAAVAALRRGMAAIKGRTDIPRLLYAVYARTGRNAEADRFASEWLKAYPDDSSFEFEVSAVATGRGDLASAEIHLQRVVSLQPGHAMALNNLAWVLVQQGKPGAVALAQKAVDLSPNQPAIIDTLALALAADKRPGDALPLQKRAVELSPGDNAMHLNLARIALQAGDKALARTELERLRALGDAFKEQGKVSELMKAI